MSFTDSIKTSINIAHDAVFDIYNIEYAKSNLSPNCNRFVTFEVSDGMQVDVSSFDSFINGIQSNSNIGILASEALNEPLAVVLETNFQIEFRDIPWENGILNFESGYDIISKQKVLKIENYHGNIFLQRFALDSRGVAALPEMLKPPYDIIEYCGLFIMKPDFIYLSSNTPLSMKAALFVLANPELYDSVLSNNRSIAVRLRHSPKIDSNRDLFPYQGNISIFPMKNIASNTP